ncbi:hypothetical protein HNQ93_001710 [Hymenobacter luteus]|uniref:Uncharacterized protein n=2 Tax=Hymenobacter TaxID=89966 RepID=A0A7W9T1P5_9BACT|nr:MULTISPECIES: hypothetical protein [Hymenobacter]MBB4600929.1 hypothetical protein [Hymenobacter latericoloratus]MBB6058864.1 hypothetical protein [Hymenobacter luteus]
MNYVQHTRAAHQQLAAQSAATPHHVSLYWALFFEWNAARFPADLPLDHAALMRAAHIGNEKTYRAALRDLTAWQLLTYQPSHTRYQLSTCRLADLSATPSIGSESASHAPLSSGAEVPALPTTGASSASATPDASGAQMLEPARAVLPLMPPASGPEVPPHSLYRKTGGSSKHSTTKPTPFGRSEAPHPEKKIGQPVAAAVDDELSAVEILLEDTPLADSARPHGRGAHTATIRQAAATPRPGRPTRPEITFAESEYADVEKFILAFEGTDYALADLRLYHEKVRLWRDRKTGEPPRRRDWLATAQRFMLNDAHDNRLKLAPPTPPHGTPAGPGGPQPGSTIDALYEQFYPRRPG